MSVRDVMNHLCSSWITAMLLWRFHEPYSACSQCTSNHVAAQCEKDKRDISLRTGGAAGSNIPDI